MRRQLACLQLAGLRAAPGYPTGGAKVLSSSAVSSRLPLAAAPVGLFLATGSLAGGLLAISFDASDYATDLWTLAASLLLWVGLVPAVFSCAAAVPGPPTSLLAVWAGQAFCAGAVVAIVDALGANSPLLMGLRGLATGVVAVQMARLYVSLTARAPLYVPSSAAVRYLSGLLAGVIFGAALADILTALPLPLSLGWFRQALVDITLLGSLLPLSFAAAVTWWPAMHPDALAAPARWLSYLSLYVHTVVAAVPLLAWLWRFPGAAATPGVVAVTAALLLLTALLLWPSRRPQIAPPELAVTFFSPLLAAAAALLCYAAASAAIGLRQNSPLLQEYPIALWVLGYRWSMGFVCVSAGSMCVSATFGSRRPAVAAAAWLVYLLGALSAAVLHWRWMLGPASAVSTLWAAVVFWTAMVAWLAMAPAAAREQRESFANG